MVLDEASSSTFPDDASPTSDPFVTDDYNPNSNTSNTNDPYIISVNPPNYTPQVYLDLRTLNDVNPARASPENLSPLRKTLQKTYPACTSAVDRALTLPEAEAIASSMAHSADMGRGIKQIGFFIGCILAWRGRRKYRFPFQTPGEAFNPNRFGPLSGRLARGSWHTVRFFAYTALGSLAGGVFGAQYAVSVARVTMGRDPRMKGFWEEAQRRQREKMGTVMPVDESPGARAGETFEMARQRSEIQRRVKAGKTEAQMERDFAGDEAERRGESLLSDAQIEKIDGRSAREERRRTERYIDDASPTAGGGDDWNDPFGASYSDKSASKAPASSWERLRQDALSNRKDR